MSNIAYIPKSHDRSLAGIIADIREELTIFVQTRTQMFQAEMKEKAEGLKTVAPAASIAVVTLATAFLLLTMAVVALVAVAFWGSPYAWFLAFLIVGVVWASVGGVSMHFARRAFQAQRLVPDRTIRILQQDKDWLENEAGTYR